MRHSDDPIARMRLDDVVDSGAHPFHDFGCRFFELQRAVVAELELDLDESSVFAHVFADDARGLDCTPVWAGVDGGRADSLNALGKSLRLAAPQRAERG